MKYDLIIDSRPSEVVIALLRDGLLIELHKEKHDNNYLPLEALIIHLIPKDVRSSICNLDGNSTLCY